MFLCASPESRIYMIDIEFSREFYASETKEELLQCVEEIVENANEILERDWDQRFEWEIDRRSRRYNFRN